MKFTVTGLDETGSVDSAGDVVNARGGTEMMKEGLLERLDPELSEKFNIICSRVRDLDPDKNLRKLFLDDQESDDDASLYVPSHKAGELGATITVLNDDEWDKLLEVASKKKPYFMKAIVIIARETLCRRGELLRLTKHDINWRQGTARINKTKNNTPREIGLSPLALETLRSLPDTPDGRFFPCKSVHSFNSYWRKVLRDAKLRGVFTFHRLRHQGATDLAEDNWSIAELSAQGGWKSLSSLKRYTHIQAKHLAKKMKGKV